MSSISTERHPLGLPAGSIRAILAVAITAMFCLYLFWPPPEVKVPLYLYGLLTVVLVFFAGHGSSITPSPGGQTPMHLPRGTFRVLIMGAIGATLIYQYVTNSEQLLQRLQPPQNQWAGWPFVFLSLVGGYAAGWLIAIGPWRRSPWFQDLKAWISLIALLVLAAKIVIELFISPNRGLPGDELTWDCILLATISCYYGSRS